MTVRVARINWSDVGKVEAPGRYMFKFGWVTITEDDLTIWSQFLDATFALYEVSGDESNEFRLGTAHLGSEPEAAP